MLYALTGCSPTKGAYGGEDITIYGSGLDSSMAPSVTIGSKGTCVIQSMTSSTIICRTPSSTASGYQNIVYA